MVPPTGGPPPPAPRRGFWPVTAARPGVLAPPPRASRAAGSRARREWSRGFVGPVRAGVPPAPSQTHPALGLPGPFPPVGGEDPEKPFCPCLEPPQLGGGGLSRATPLPSTAWEMRERAPPKARCDIRTRAPPRRPRSPTQRRCDLLRVGSRGETRSGTAGAQTGDKRS